MQILTSSITLIVLCISFLIAVVSPQEDTCAKYKDFECDKESPRRSSWMDSILEDDADCGANLVETTLKLFQEGDEVINKQMENFDPSKDKEAVLMIGSTGTGKSTLTYFIAGNDSAIISFERYGDKVITDCNGKIGGSGIISQTTFPELVFDTDTSTAFFDYPGFFDTRAACVEIANAYFMLNVARKVPRAKFIIVTEYASVTNGNKGAFPKLLQSVMNFIPSIKSFAPAIAMVATKVDKPNDLESKLVNNIKEFLTDAKKGLNATFVGKDDIERAHFLVDTFLGDGRIGVFRAPDDCGPLSEIPLMKENKKSLENIIFTNLKYVSTKDDDFGVSLSGDAKTQIINLRGNLSSMVTESLKMLSDAVEEYLTFDCTDPTQCTQLLTTAGVLFEDPNFIDGYEKFDTGPDALLNTIVMKTTQVYFDIPGIQVHPNISGALNTSSGYLDFLGTLDNIQVSIPPIFKPFQDLKRLIVSGITTLGTDLGSKMEFLIRQYSEFVFDNLFLGIECTDEVCQDLMTNLETLYTNPEFQNGYSYDSNWSDMTYTQIVKHITGFTFSGFIVDPQIVDTLLKYSGYLDVLKELDTDININVQAWLSHPQQFKIKVTNEVSYLTGNLTSNITASLGLLSDAVENAVTFGCAVPVNCNSTIEILGDLHGDLGFLNGYDKFDHWLDASLYSIVTNTTHVYFNIAGISVPQNVSTILENSSKNIDSLQAIDYFVVNLPNLYQPLQKQKVRIAAGLTTLSSDLSLRIELLVQQYSEFVLKNLFLGVQCTDEVCQNLMKNLETLYTNSDFKNGYTYNSNWSDMTYTQIVEHITGFTFSGFIVEPQILEKLFLYSRYLDVLKEFDNDINVNLQSWLYHPQQFKLKVTTEVSYLSGNLTTSITASLGMLSNAVENAVTFGCTVPADCKSTIDILGVLYRDFGFVNGYDKFDPWLDASLNTIVTNTTHVYFNIPGISVPQNVSKSLENSSKNIDLLKSIDNFVISIPNLYQPLQKQKVRIATGVTTLSTDLSSRIQLLVKNFSETVFAKLFPGTPCASTDCHTLMTNLQTLFDDSDFKDGYLSLGTSLDLTYTEIVTRIAGFTFSGFTIDPPILPSLLTYSGYLDALKDLGTGKTVTVVEWLQHSKKMKQDVTAEVSVNLRNHFVSRVTSLLAPISAIVYEKLFPTNQNPCDKRTCTEILKNLNVIYLKKDFDDLFPGDVASSTLENIILRYLELCKEFYSENVQIAELKSTSHYLDQLKGFIKSLEVNIGDWITNMQQLKTKTDNGVRTVLITSVNTRIQTATNEMYVSLFENVNRGFSENDDVFAVPERIKKIGQDIAKYKNDINADYANFDDGLVVKSFVKKTISNFEQLNFTNAEELFIIKFDSAPFFIFFEAYKFSTQIIQSSLNSIWYTSLTTFETNVEQEGNWYNFVVDLMGDLTNNEIQLASPSPLRTWWATNGPIDANDEFKKLKLFWTQFQSVPAIRKLDIDDVVAWLTASSHRDTKFASLNALLKITLKDTFNCVLKNVNTLCFCDGNFVSLTNVIASETCKHSSISTLVIMTYHTLFVDVNINGPTTFGNANNLDVVIISPKWWNTNNFIFNLNGVDAKSYGPTPGSDGRPGAPGNPGGKAGNLFGVGDDFTKFTTFATSALVNGGKGANGQNGEPGTTGIDAIVTYVPWSDGRSADSEVDNISESYCSAWSDGDIVIWSPRPNTCGTGRCRGGRHYLDSTRGTDGGNGGDGGVLGRGGLPGKYYFPIQGVYDAQGIKGDDGIGGSGGPGGRGGNKVGRARVEIESYYDKSDAEYRCRGKEQTTEVDNDQYPKGDPGQTGTNGNEKVPAPQTFDPNSFKTQVNEFQKTAESYADSNEFLKSLLNNFLTRIRETLTIPQ